VPVRNRSSLIFDQWVGKAMEIDHGGDMTNYS
jgi:hypothetical protein